MTSILNHPDYESCIKLWCKAVAEGKEPPRVEAQDDTGKWFALIGGIHPSWDRSMRYRLAPRTIRIGDREVNAPVEMFTRTNIVVRFNGDATRPVYFANEQDAESAAHAIIELLSKQ